MNLLDAEHINDADIATLEDAVDAMPTDSQLGFALRSLLDNIAEGRTVVVDTADKRVSPADAAKMLDMSRTHLYKLLDAGTIASVRVGRDRRITLEAIADFKATRDKESKRLAERFATTHARREALLDDLLDD